MENIGEVKYNSYDAQKCEIREQTEKSINSLFEKGVITNEQKQKLLQMYLNGEVSFGDDGLTEEEAQNFTSETFTQIQNAIQSFADRFRTKTMYIVQYGDTPEKIAEKMGLTGEEAKKLAQDIKATAQRQSLWYKYGLRVGDMIQINGDFQDKIDALKQSGEYLDSTDEINDNYNTSRRLQHRGRGRTGQETPETPESPKTPPKKTGRPQTPPISRTPEIPRKPPMEPQKPQGPTEAQREAAQKVYDEATHIVKELGPSPSPVNKVLKRITPENVVFVMKMYQDTYHKSLAKTLVGKGDKRAMIVYNKLCHNLCIRAKKLGVAGIYFGDAQKCIDHPDKMYEWLDIAYSKILAAEKKKNPAFVSNADYETSRKRTEYEDTTKLRKDSTKVARELHNAIYDKESGIIGSIKNMNNSVTIGILKKITPSNAAFVVRMYKDTYKKDLARDIDDEIGLGIKEIKEYICSKLVKQANKLKLHINTSYQAITKIDPLVSWIDSISNAIITAMDGNASTLPSDRGEETVKSKNNGIRVRTITNGPMFVEADITKVEEEYNKQGEKIKSREYFKDGKVVQEEQYVLVFKDKKLVKSYPLYDDNGNKRAVPKDGKIVRKRTLLKHGSSYKPTAASNITEPVPMEITLPNNASDNAKKFARALERNKAHLMKVLKIDNDTFNRLAKLAMAIAEQETNFGTNTRYGKYLIAGADTVLTAIGSAGALQHGALNQAHNLSFGVTQIKFDMHSKDADVKALWNSLGITNGVQLYDMEKSAVATMALLSVLNKRVKSKEMQAGIEAANGRVVTNEGWEKKNGTLVKTYNTKAYVNEVDEDDAIAYMWNTGGLPVKYGSMDPLGYEYTRNVRKYKKKYNIKESAADRKAAAEKSRIRKRNTGTSFTPMDNNGPMGSIIFMPKMYSNKPVNKREEIEILKKGLKDNPKINSESKLLLIRAVEHGELAFEFGLTAQEVASLTQRDVDLLLNRLHKLKQKIENESNVRFSDGISDAEAKTLGDKFRKYIRQSEYQLKRDYLNSRSKQIKLTDADRKNTTKLNGSNPNVAISKERRGFAGNIPDKGVNSSGTSAPSAALAKIAQKTSAKMTQDAKSKGKAPGGYCMTGFRQAIRAAGIDDSDLVEGTPRASVRFFERHPDMFEEVKWIDLGNGNGRQINSTDLPKLPAGYIVVWVPDPNFSKKEGHISITNGNGQAYADETDNLDWGGFAGKDHEGEASGKGEHGHFRVFRLTDKWTVGPDGKLKFNK